MKKRESASITGAELKVMEELWRRGEATIGDLRDALYPQGGSSKFATVQKLLTRLAAKKLVRRRKNDANWVFQALVARNDLIGGELRRQLMRQAARRDEEPGRGGLLRRFGRRT